MDKRTEQERVGDAKKIAALIKSTDTDQRGFLFDEIGIELNKSTQFYTGNLFRHIAAQYNR